MTKPLKLLKLIKLPMNNKNKYQAVFLLDNKKEKKLSFGSQGFRDFTLMNNKNSKFFLTDPKERDKVKERYIKRHKQRENWDSPMTRGSLSGLILWNKKTISASLKDYKSKFKL